MFTPLSVGWYRVLKFKHEALVLYFLLDFGIKAVKAGSSVSATSLFFYAVD